MGSVLAVIAAFFMSDTPSERDAPTPEEVASTIVETVSYMAPLGQPETEDGDDDAANVERWAGVVDLGASEIRFTIRIEQQNVGWSGSVDIPMQGVEGLALSKIVRTDSEIAFVAPLIGTAEVNWPKWAFTIGETGEATGTLRQAGAEFPSSLRLAGENEDLGPQRPQEPKPPFPYRSEEVRVPTESGHTLAGTLVLPDPAAFAPPYATAVFMTGSGPQDRDETILGHKPFLIIADHLARRGIASLRCDDRGFGESTGDYAAATTLDFADDARAQIAFLAANDSVASIGLIGHSEGGLAAPFVAADTEAVDWVVLLAATGVPGREIMIEQTKAILLAADADPDLVERQAEAQDAVFDAIIQDDDAELDAQLRKLVGLQMQSNGVAPDEQLVDGMVQQQKQGMISQPWFRLFMTLDPRPALAKVNQPVLVLNGSLDLQVLPDQNVPEIEKALAHNNRVEVHVLEGLNHMFQPAATGAPSEYVDIETTFDPKTLEIISGWIRRR